MGLYLFFLHLTTLLAVCEFSALCYPLPLADDIFALNCGSSGNSTDLDGRQWTGDVASRYVILQGSRGRRNMVSSTPLGKHLIPPPLPVPYMTARISRSTFTYTFRVTPGQKFIRLHFYPTEYPGFERSKAFFTVKAGPYTLLSNFSAAITADVLALPSFRKEFCVHMEDGQPLILTFSPSSEEAYAFVNGIEIVSIPTGLYHSREGDDPGVHVGKKFRYPMFLDTSFALETVHRLNVGGSSILPIEDTGMFREWFEDSNYLLESRAMPITTTIGINYAIIPTHSAPTRVYQTSRSMARDMRAKEHINFTWKLPVDQGFRYLLRFHFCELEYDIKEFGQMKFNISIDNQIAEANADIIKWAGGNGIAVYRDYMVTMEGDRTEGKRDMTVTLSPHKSHDDKGNMEHNTDAILKGLEVFKLSNPDNNLAGVNMVPIAHALTSPNSKPQKVVLGYGIYTIANSLIRLLIILNVVVYPLAYLDKKSDQEDILSSLPFEGPYRRFSLVELQLATKNFDDGLVIGSGGFGDVYKGLIDEGTVTIAIKRMKPKSKQGPNEFWMEIETISKFRHKHLVRLLGYCDECDEKILVYEYMEQGTLAKHLYKKNTEENDNVCHMSWEQRLKICIGAARGLDYLHTGIQSGVIHRDVKTTNILLDKNMVAKVSDFGLCKVGTTSHSVSHVSTNVKGTFGYFDPHYFSTRNLTKKADVYAFGVVLLEVLCGRPAVDLSLEEEQRGLSSWAQGCIKDGKLNEIIDPVLRGQLPIPSKSLEVFVEVARKCLHIHPNGRPTMADVVVSLERALAYLQDDRCKDSSTTQDNEDVVPSPSAAVQYTENKALSKKRTQRKLTKVFHKISTALLPRTVNFEWINRGQLSHKTTGLSLSVIAQPETASTLENQPNDEPQTSRFTWTIENFSRLNTRKHYSEVFIVGGYKWRLLIFPKGNRVDYLSMYLVVADSATLLYGWTGSFRFCLSLVNQVHAKYTIRKETQRQFNASKSDRGFTCFMPLSELYDGKRGFLVNDTCVVEVAVRRVIDYTYDSKKETGYVGLKNQGATCYMNSLLQTLYHIPCFRKAVYHMSTTKNDMLSGSIPLALQSLFYKLQYNHTSVSTKELTKSFGSDAYNSFKQHDVQEFNRVLCEKLEDKMKGTVVEGTIQQLFEGHNMNYIECINVDLKSTRKESFNDLQLAVKGCRDVYASFDKYVEVERLEGDNKYLAEDGLQDVKKRVLFIDFPPVLQLQLKRFEYDFMWNTMVKINDRYEFPLQLDLDREDGKYLSPEANRSVRNLYTLHSVLVHSGGVHGGHYYSFIRPTLSNQWLKFDDKWVTKEDMKTALEEQYGGEEELPQTNPTFNNTQFKFTKYSNAYMLVYIRESDKEKIICNADDIAEHLRIRLEKELEEEGKRRYKAQADLYTIIKVARDEDLMQQIGKDIYFDLVDHERVHSFRIQKQMPFKLFKEEVAKEFGVPVQFQRFWIWAERANHTYRPYRPLTPHEKTQSVWKLRELSNQKRKVEVELFLEVEIGMDRNPIPLPDKTKEDILLFFKLYDPQKEEVRFVGRLFVKSSGKPHEILTKLNEMAGFSPEEEVELYEEIKFEPNIMCERIDKRATFRFSQIGDGDIICFQKSSSLSCEEQCRYPDVPSFLKYVHNCQIVHFRSLRRPKEDDFCLELSKLHTYDDVVERVAHRLGVNDPSKIRLTPHNCYSHLPKRHPIKYRGAKHLLEMLVHHNQMSLCQNCYRCLKTLKVAFHRATKDEVVIHNIRLPSKSTVGAVLNELKKRVELSHANAELRMVAVFYHKIYEIFALNKIIENIDDQYCTLRAEEVPEEEKNLGPLDRLIQVCHFTKETGQNQMQLQIFGEPFFLVIHEGKTLADIKERIQKKLQAPDEEFTKGQLMQMTMMTPPSFNNELHYLNEEDRLLRWLLVKHRNTKYGLDFLNEDDEKGDLMKFNSCFYEDMDADEDENDDDDDDNDECNVEQRDRYED